MKNVLEPLVRTIKDYRSACMKIAEANIQFAQSFAPRLTNLTGIRKIYDIYVKFAKDSNFKEDGTDNNKQFLFLILYFYSPASLCGGKINCALRKTIAATLGISADTALYKMRAKSVSWYKIYPDFRRECNIAIEEIENHLEDL